MTTKRDKPIVRKNLGDIKVIGLQLFKPVNDKDNVAALDVVDVDEDDDVEGAMRIVTVRADDEANVARMNAIIAILDEIVEDRDPAAENGGRDA